MAINKILFMAKEQSMDHMRLHQWYINFLQQLNRKSEAQTASLK